MKQPITCTKCMDIHAHATHSTLNFPKDRVSNLVGKWWNCQPWHQVYFSALTLLADCKEEHTAVPNTCQFIIKCSFPELKLINHLCATLWMPPDYWQTDNSSGLVMVIRNYHWLNSASRVLISTCSTPLVQTGEQFFTVWSWPLTYDLNLQSKLANIKVDHHAKNQGQRSNGSNRRAPTDKRTDTYTDATKHIISPVTRSITSGEGNRGETGQLRCMLSWQWSLNEHHNKLLYCRLVALHSGRMPVSGQQTFSVPRLTCSWWVTATVGKPSATAQPTRLTQPFILLGLIN